MRGPAKEWKEPGAVPVPDVFVSFQSVEHGIRMLLMPVDSVDELSSCLKAS